MAEAKSNSALSEHLKLLETGEYSDVTFAIGPEKEEVKAHKLFLVSRSPVFKAMLSEPWHSSDSEVIEIPDTDIGTFRSFLKFLYTDQLDPKEIPDHMNLYYLGDKYDVQALLLKCDDVLASKFDLKNCLELHQVAKVCTRQDLLVRIEKKIAEKFIQFSITPEFLQNEDEELLRSLLKRDDLNIDEIDLFEAIVRWGQAQQIKNQEGPDQEKTLNSVLEHVLPFIRFPTMTLAQFASVVRPTKLVPSEDMVDIFTYLASTGDQRHELGRALAYNTVPRRRVLTLDEQQRAAQQEVIGEDAPWRRSRTRRELPERAYWARREISPPRFHSRQYYQNVDGNPLQHEQFGLNLPLMPEYGMDVL